MKSTRGSSSYNLFNTKSWYKMGEGKRIWTSLIFWIVGLVREGLAMSLILWLWHINIMFCYKNWGRGGIKHSEHFFVYFVYVYNLPVQCLPVPLLFSLPHWVFSPNHWVVSRCQQVPSSDYQTWPDSTTHQHLDCTDHTSPRWTRNQST